MFWWIPFTIPIWVNDYYNEDANAMYAPLEYEYCHCSNFTVIDKRHDMITNVNIPRFNNWILNGNDQQWYRADNGIMYDKLQINISYNLSVAHGFNRICRNSNTTFKCDNSNL